MRRHPHVIPVIGHLLDGQFRQLEKNTFRQQASPATTCWTQGTMNLTAARVMIKFLDGQDHHRAAVLMRGPLPDFRDSRMKVRYRQQRHHTEIARPR